ncbi:hypothetical protein ABC733_14785 [Mangrovibacter sp. SLW1]
MNIISLLLDIFSILADIAFLRNSGKAEGKSLRGVPFRKIPVVQQQPDEKATPAENHHTTATNKADK